MAGYLGLGAVMTAVKTYLHFVLLLCAEGEERIQPQLDERLYVIKASDAGLPHVCLYGTSKLTQVPLYTPPRVTADSLIKLTAQLRYVILR